MDNYGRVQLGDAVRYRLADDSWLYGVVEAIRAEDGTGADRRPAAIARVAFPVTDQSLAPVRAECDSALLLPLADPELRAFLTANTGRHWSRPQNAATIDAALIELRATAPVRQAG